MAINESSTQAAIRGPEDGGAEWCERHGFNRLMVPFAYRETDPIQLGRDLDAYIMSRRPTAATFVPGRALDFQPDPVALQYHLALRGSWKIETSDRPKYVNPDYVHVRSFGHGIIEDTGERLDVLDRMARSGIPELGDLAPMFGLTTRELEVFCEQYDVDWREKWLRGRERTIRSCCLAVEWGYSPREVAESLPVADSVVWHWLQSHALDDVPRDPSFGLSGRAEQ